MKIAEALKSEDIRVTKLDNRWLYYSEFEGGWIVREQRRYARMSTVLISTQDEEEAVRVLIGDNNET